MLKIRNIVKFTTLIFVFVFIIGQGRNLYSENHLDSNKSSTSLEIERMHKYNENLFNNLKKIKPLGKGAQGNTFLCKNKKTNKKYVLKNTKADHISYSNTIYEKFPEFLACEKLANFDCEYIAKPLAYEQISDDAAKILLEYAENNVDLNSLTIQEKKEILKQILSVRRQLHDIGLIHGDIYWNNLSIKRNINKKLGIKIFDFGRSNAVKDSYDKCDLMRASHPWIDLWTIYQDVIYAFSNDKQLINKLNKNIEKELPNLYNLKNINPWVTENRKQYASKILKIPLNNFDKFNKIIEKWINDIKP